MSLSTQRITYRSLHRFPLETDDCRNGTNTSRKIHRYTSHFSFRYLENWNLSDFLRDRPEQIKGKIRVLDSGAGKGVALSTLLESEFQEKIKKVTGISLHSFNSVKNVLEKHKDRIEWYLDDAAEIMGKLPSEYDLITDVWGSYSYSKQRVALIKTMHQALRIGGRAYISTPIENPLHIENLVNIEGKQVSLESHLAEKYPETFKCFPIEEGYIFVINKVSKRCPSIDYEPRRAYYRSSCTRFSRQKIDAMRENSWYPRKVYFKRTASKTQLRPLKEEPEQKRGKNIQDS